MIEFTLFFKQNNSASTADVNPPRKQRKAFAITSNGGVHSCISSFGRFICHTELVLFRAID